MTSLRPALFVKCVMDPDAQLTRSEAIFCRHDQLIGPGEHLGDPHAGLGWRVRDHPREGLDQEKIVEIDQDRLRLPRDRGEYEAAGAELVLERVRAREELVIFGRVEKRRELDRRAHPGAAAKDQSAELEPRCVGVAILY